MRNLITKKINNEVDTYNKQLIKLNDIINKPDNSTCNNLYSCKLHGNLIANNKIQLGNISILITTHTKTGVKYSKLNIFRKLSSLTLTYDVGNDENKNHTFRACPTCGEKFAAKLGCAQHPRQSKDCKIIFTLDKYFLKNARLLVAIHTGQHIIT